MKRFIIGFGWLMAACVAVAGMGKSDDWLKPYLAQFGVEYARYDGFVLWEPYVACLNPMDAESQFKAFITMGADGKPVITWEPDMTKADPPRVYVEYGKANLTDKDWTPVSDANRATMRFFKVGVKLTE